MSQQPKAESEDKTPASEIVVDAETLEKAQELEKKAVDRNTYRASKRDLIMMEEGNRSEIILQKCAGDGNWFEMADNSALLYYYHVGRRIKIKNILFRDDNDSFFEQYKIGKIAARGIGAIRKRVIQAGLYAREYRMNTKWVIVLNKTFTDEQVRALYKKEVKRRMDLNKTVEIAHADPIFYRNLSELIKKFHRICSSKLDKLSSQTNGARIVSLADDMMSLYLHSTDLNEDMLDARIEDWKSIRSKAYHLKYEIQILDIAGLWSAELCLNAFESAEFLIRGASDNLGKLLQKKNAESIAKLKENKK